jgi:dTDP-4-dehydrorhamnose reductase
VRALVVGSRGQLGQALAARLGEGCLWAGDREELDVRQAAAVNERVRATHPDVVFNATAYNAVDAAEDDPLGALAVNAVAVRHLARACAEVGALLVHVSTDYVFDGDATRPYREDDPTNPPCVYGASKLAGESLVRASGAEHLIIRTSGVIGRGGSEQKGGSFVERIVAQARAGKPLRVVADQVFAPTVASDLATAAIALARSSFRGLVHVTSGGSCSWHELASAALAVCGLDAPIEKITVADLALPARRPLYSVLDCSRYLDLGLFRPRHWKDALPECLGTQR